MRRLHSRHLKIIFGLIISGGSLWFSLHLISLSEFYNSIIQVNSGALAAMAGFIFLGLIFRYVRWIFVSGNKLRDFQPYFISSVIGIFGNFVLPFRLGEIARILALEKLLKTPLSLSIATSIVDRSLDLIMLFLGGLMLVYFFPRNEIINTILFSSFLVTIVLCIVFVFLHGLRSEIGRLFKRVILILTRRLSGNINSIKFFSDIRESLFNSVIYSMSFRTIIVTTIVFCIDCFTLTLLIQTFSGPMPFYAGLLLWVFMSVSSFLPSAPGFIGVYQLAAVVGLSLLNIEPVISIVIATTYQGIVLILFSLLVGIILALKGVGETKKLLTTDSSVN
jgi:uncharacterized protein (TIRG00374 family)